MITRCLLLFFSMLTLVCADVLTTGVDVSLLSEQRAIAAGKPFTVALKIHHHAKYHTYWQHPGIVGVATSIKWQLPAGFTAGNIQWPYPERVMMKQYPAIGYERDVMLLVEITPPADLTGEKVTLRATAAWMACAEGCYPGEKTLELTLPVAAAAQPDASLTAAFAAARAEIPQPLEHWRASIFSDSVSSRFSFRLTRNDKQASDPGKVQVFSCDGQIAEVIAQMAITNDGGIRFMVTRADSKDQTTLPCVLVGEKPFWEGGPRWVSIDPVYSK